MEEPKYKIKDKVVVVLGGQKVQLTVRAVFQEWNKENRYWLVEKLDEYQVLQSLAEIKHFYCVNQAGKQVAPWRSTEHLNSCLWPEPYLMPSL